MRRVILMRHAKSSWDNGIETDFDRTLDPRGRRDAPRMGSWMKDRGIEIDHVLCSDAVRTRETHELWQSGYEKECPVSFQRELYHTSPEGMSEQIRQVPDSVETVLVIAHNPGTQLLAAMLSGQQRKFPTAACIGLRFDDLNSWAEWPGGKPAVEEFFQVPRELPE